MHLDPKKTSDVKTTLYIWKIVRAGEMLMKQCLIDAMY